MLLSCDRKTPISLFAKLSKLLFIVTIFKGTLTMIISPRGTDQQQSSVSKRMRTCPSITSKFSASTTFARSTCSNGTIRRMALRAAFSKSLKSLLILSNFKQAVQPSISSFMAVRPIVRWALTRLQFVSILIAVKQLIFFHQLITIQNFWMRLRNRLRKFCTYLLFVFTATICFKRGEDYQLLTPTKPTNNTKQSG